MAESISCNIIVEEKENSLGKIILESGCFVLPSLGNRAIHKVFSNLFLAANDACVDISIIRWSMQDRVLLLALSGSTGQ